MTFDAQRGRILPPDLDDRTWQDLVDQMRVLIPRYAPGWTDHNPSDLGITLLELFAWLTEGVVYRLNQVPDKNYIAFLGLLGITRDPPTPARTFLTFVGGGAPVDVAAGSQASTAASQGQPPIVFETDEDVRVLPQRLDTVVQLGPAGAGGAGPGPVPCADASATLVGPPASAVQLTVAPGQTAQFCLGLDAAPTEAIRLGVRLVRPVPAGSLAVAWTYSTGSTEPLAWAALPAAGLLDGTAGLTRDGVVVLTPQPGWAAQRAVPAPGAAASTAWTSVVVPPTATPPRSDPRFWLGVRLVNAGPAAAAVDLGVGRLLLNAAAASTALTLRTPEIIGRSNGAAFQTYQLSHRPLYRRPDLRAPYGDLVVEVGTGTPAVWEAWTLVDDLPAGPGNVYLADSVTGEITFGDHDPQTLTGHGSVPPAGSAVRARYRYIDQGAAGNVGAGQVIALGTAPGGGGLPGLAAVTNLAAAAEGTDEESIEDTLRRAPEQLKIRDRAITAEDYEFLAREASNEVVITRCLTPKLGADGSTPWTYAGIIRAPGTVNVVVVPDQGPVVSRPDPTPELLAEVLAYLDRRRDVGAHLQVTGPRYCPIVVSTQIVVWRQEFQDPVHAQTLDRITAFLHPTRGGPGGAGWQVGQPVFSSDLFQAIMPTPDIGYITSLQIKPGVPPYVGSGDVTKLRPFWQPDFAASVRLTDYELVCAADPSAHTVTTITQVP